MLLTNLQDGQILQYSDAEHKFINVSSAVTPSAVLSLQSTSPVQTGTITKPLTNVLETIGTAASQAYTENSLFVGVDGYFYKATVDIAQGNTLTLNGNCVATNIRAEITNLTQSLNGFMFDEDSQTGKGKYSMDGGSTWQNFSSGSEDDWTNYSTTDSAYFTTTTASKTFHLGKGTCVFVTAKRYGNVHHVTIEVNGKTQALTLQGADNQVVKYGVFIVNEEQDVIVRQTDSSVYGDATVYLDICNPPTT